MQPAEFLAARIAEAKVENVFLGAHPETDLARVRALLSRDLEALEGYERILERYEHVGSRAHHKVGEPYDTRSGAMYVTLGEVIIDLAYAWKHHPDWDPEWEVKG